MYKERTSQGLDLDPSLRRETAVPSNALRDYLRSGRARLVRSAPLVRPAPPPFKRHMLVLQRGIRLNFNQRFEFDAEGFDITLTQWKPGTPFALPAVPISLIVVDFEAGAYADTAFYPILTGAFPGVPVIILATSDGPIDRILALELGADDFISKPAHPREFQARVRAVLKHMPYTGQTAGASGTSYGAIHLDVVNRTATTARGLSKLCNVEFWLLHTLVEAKGQPVAREVLLNCLETEARESHRCSRSIDVTIGRIRNKIDTPGSESLIRTIRGLGYCI